MTSKYNQTYSEYTKLHNEIESMKSLKETLRSEILKYNDAKNILFNTTQELKNVINKQLTENNKEMDKYNNYNNKISELKGSIKNYDTRIVSLKDE